MKYILKITQIIGSGVLNMRAVKLSGLVFGHTPYCGYGNLWSVYQISTAYALPIQKMGGSKSH